MDVPLEIGLLSALKSLTLHGNPQKLIRSHILQQGNEAVISYLRDKVPDEWKERAEKMTRGADVKNNDGADGGYESAYIRQQDKSRELSALSQEIEELENQIDLPSISSAMQFKLKKEIALKRAQLIRLNREMKN